MFVTVKICWPLLRYASDTPEFGMASGLILALTVAVVPMFAPYNQILLLPAVLVLVQNAQILKKQQRWILFLYVATIFVLMWSWVSSMALVGLHFAFPDIARTGWKLPFISTFTFPLMLFATAASHIYQLVAKQQIPASISEQSPIA